MDNPAFRNEAFRSGAVSGAQDLNAQQLQELYEQPSYVREETDPMTVDDTLAKTFGAFVVLLAGAVVGWFSAPVVPFLFLGAALVAFVLGLVQAFKKEPSVGLIMSYAAFEGVFLGGISAFFEASWPGIVLQAVIATFCVVGVTLALFVSGKVRASARATKVFLVAMVAYAVFSVVNLVLMLTGASDDPWGLRGADIMGIPLGLILGVLAVLMGAYSLVLDFEFVKNGVENRAPRRFGWFGAFGVLTTVVWLYIEILRLIAIFRDR